MHYIALNSRLQNACYNFEQDEYYFAVAQLVMVIETGQSMQMFNNLVCSNFVQFLILKRHI
jgi:hypothetical protein